MSGRGLLLVGLGLVSLAGAVALAVAADRPPDDVPVRGVLFLLLGLSLPPLAAACALRFLPPPRRTVPFLFVVGVLLRVVFFFPDPYFSDDVYRYLWDGRVQLAGEGPYGVPPADSSLDAVEDSWPAEARVRERVNHPEIPTIYPPLLELAYGGVALLGGGLGLWRALLVLLDLGVALLVLAALRRRGRDSRLVVLYLWHPLPLVENVWSAHAEVVAIFLLLGGLVLLDLDRRRGAGAAWGLAGAAKLLPFGLLPFLAVRRGVVPALAAVAAAAVTIIPYLGTSLEAALSGLRTYAETWYFNDMLFRPLGMLLGIDVEDRTLEDTQRLRRGLGLAWAGICVAVAWAVRDPWRAALWVIGAFLILTPTLHPWYILWILPLAIVRGNRPWLLLTVLGLAAYSVKVVEREAGVWFEAYGVRLMEFLPPLILAAWLGLRRRSSSAAAPAGTPAGE